MFSFLIAAILNTASKQVEPVEPPEETIDPQDDIFEEPFDGDQAADDTQADSDGVDDDGNEAPDDDDTGNESDFDEESDYDEQEDFEEQSDYDEQDDWEEQHENLDDFAYDESTEYAADSQESRDDDAGDDDATDDTAEYTAPTEPDAGTADSVDLETILDETVFDDPEPFQEFMADVFEEMDQLMDHDEFIPEFNVDNWIDPGLDPFDEFMRNTF